MITLSVIKNQVSLLDEPDTQAFLQVKLNVVVIEFLILCDSFAPKLGKVI